MTRLTQVAVFSGAIVSSHLAHAQLPDEFESLKAKRNQTVTTAIRDIDAKYLNALAAIKDKFTKAGNLEKAVAVDAEMKGISSGLATISGNPTVPMKLPDFDGVWTSVGGKTYTMKDGNFNDGEKKVATLTIENAKERKVLLKWASSTDAMKVSAGCDMMCGKNTPFNDTVWWEKVKR
jgi:hypothetical protein